MLSLPTLIAGGIGPTQARRFAAPLIQVFGLFGISTPLRQAAFVAQCAHESIRFTALEENLYYSTAARIRMIFPSRVKTLARARELVGNPQALANLVYAGRNGNSEIGDGWKYRGRGLFQLTGRGNYSAAAIALGSPYVEHPELVSMPDDACLTAAWFWDRGKLNALADEGDIDGITLAINGQAMAGADDRRKLYRGFLKAFS